jgi:Mg2+ and Co2+ transporter CorA
MRLAAVAMVVGVVSIAACTPRVPTASVEEHRRLAQEAEELGIAQEARYEPTRTVATIPCMELCFYPWTNPTEVHHQEAKRLWRVAKQHQLAARKLRVAEARARVGEP